MELMRMLSIEQLTNVALYWTSGRPAFPGGPALSSRDL